MKNNEIKVSVIIPVYNVDTYLGECLDSVVRQSLQEIEIICVDDGSTDQSKVILKKYQGLDSRIRVIEQHNQYAGVARNNGLNIANGKYVIFLDSDDFFELDMLEKLYHVAEKESAEIVIFGYCLYDTNRNKNRRVSFPYLRNRLLSAEQIGKDLFSVCGAIPWNKLILKDFIDNQNLKYQAIKNNNDEFFNRMIVVKANRVFFYNRRFVHYRVNNPKSLQGSFGKNVLCFAEALYAIYQELSQRGWLEGNVRISFYRYANTLLENNIYRITTLENSKAIYEYLHDVALPRVYETEVPEEKTLAALILNADTHEKFLMENLNYIKENSISKKTWEYKAGEFILRFPRKLLNRE